VSNVLRNDAALLNEARATEIAIKIIAANPSYSRPFDLPLLKQRRIEKVLLINAVMKFNLPMLINKKYVRQLALKIMPEAMNHATNILKEAVLPGVLTHRFSKLFFSARFF
jgi:hypothetical protein